MGWLAVDLPLIFSLQTKFDFLEFSWILPHFALFCFKSYLLKNRWQKYYFLVFNWIISLQYKHFFGVVTLVRNSKPGILVAASFTQVLQPWEFFSDNPCSPSASETYAVTPHTEQKRPCVHAQPPASSFIVLSRYSRDMMCKQTRLSWEVPSLGRSQRGAPVPSPRRPPAPALPWACSAASSHHACPAFGSTLSPGAPANLCWSCHRRWLPSPSAEEKSSYKSRWAEGHLGERKAAQRISVPYTADFLTWDIHLHLLSFAQQAPNKDQQLLVSGAGFQIGT